MSENESQKFVYVPIPKYTKAEMKQAVAGNDIEKLIYVSLFASLYFEDRKFAHEICIKLATHPHFNVRAMAIESFDHLARIDGELNEDVVKPIIEKSLADENEFVRGKAEDAKDATKHFLKWKYRNARNKRGV